MKHKGCDSETLKERNEMVVDMFKELKRTCRYRSMLEICKVIALHPVERHYISEEMAANIWRVWKKRRTLPANTRGYKKLLYDSFIKECEKARSKGISQQGEMIRHALVNPAACMGISPTRIFVLLKRKGMK